MDSVCTDESLRLRGACKEGRVKRGVGDMAHLEDRSYGSRWIMSIRIEALVIETHLLDKICCQLFGSRFPVAVL